MDRLEIVGKLSLGLALMALAGGFIWGWSKVKIWPCPECGSKLVDQVEGEDGVNACLDCGKTWKQSD